MELRTSVRPLSPLPSVDGVDVRGGNQASGSVSQFLLLDSFSVAAYKRVHGGAKTQCVDDGITCFGGYGGRHGQ